MAITPNIDFIRRDNLRKYEPDLYDKLELNTVLDQVRESEVGHFPDDGLDTVIINLGGMCNLDCKHCDKNSDNPKKITLDRLEKTEEWEFKKAILLGGEPLLHPEFEKIVKYLKGRDIEVAVQTNGVHSPRLLSKAFLADTITFSIDGDRELHDEFRGEGSYDRTMKNLKTISKIRKYKESIRTFYLTFDYSSNIFKYIRTIDTVSGYSIEDVVDTNLVVRVTYSKDNIEWILGDDGPIERFSHLVDGIALFPLINTRYEDGSTGISRSLATQLYTKAAKSGNTDVLQTSYKHFLGKTDWKCPAGKSRVTISPDGEIYACYWLNHRIGNLGMDFEEIERTSQVFRDYYDTPQTGCISSCEGWQSCGGGCRASNDWSRCPERSGGLKSYISGQMGMTGEDIEDARGFVESGVVSVC